MKSLASLLLLIVLSLLIVYYYNVNISNGLEGCYGMHTGLLNIFLFLLGTGLFILAAFTIFSDGLLSKKAKMGFMVWLLCLPVMVILLQPIRAARLGRASWLKASRGDLMSLSILLWEDQTFTLCKGYIEASCYPFRAV